MNNTLDAVKDFYKSRIELILLNFKRIPHFCFRIIPWILGITMALLSVLKELWKLFWKPISGALQVDSDANGIIDEINNSVNQDFGGKDTRQEVDKIPFGVIKEDSLTDDEFYLTEKDENSSNSAEVITLTPIPYFIYKLKGRLHLKYKKDKEGNAKEVSSLFYKDSEFQWDWESTAILKVFIIVSFASIFGSSFSRNLKSNRPSALNSQEFVLDLQSLCRVMGATQSEDSIIPVDNIFGISFYEDSKVKSILQNDYRDVFYYDDKKPLIPFALLKKLLTGNNPASICDTYYNQTSNLKFKYNSCEIEYPDFKSLSQDEKIRFKQALYKTEVFKMNVDIECYPNKFNNIDKIVFVDKENRRKKH